MKKLIFILTTLISLYADSQSLTVYRRATNQVTTIPASDTVAGKLYTDSAYSSTYKYLKYIGTTNLNNVFPSGSIGNYGWMYVYIPSDSVFAKVIGLTTVGDATIDTFRIQVDRAVTGIYNKAFKSIKAKDFSYSFINDGSLDGRANNVVIKAGESSTMSNADIQGTNGSSTWQEPVIISAGQTDFLIIERKAP